MKSAESIECSIRIGDIAKFLLCAFGMNDISFILMVIKETRKKIDELKAKVNSFQEAIK